MEIGCTCNFSNFVYNMNMNCGKGDKKYDFVVVGAGLFGATFANLAKNDGKRVLVVDRRSHIAGNIYTENIEGINVHKYGAHIFHTD